MPSFSKNDVVLVAYPFSDRSGVKVRPAVVVSGEDRSLDVFVVPLTSKTDHDIFLGQHYDSTTPARCIFTPSCR
jgi:mRNA interferase MazF